MTPSPAAHVGKPGQVRLQPCTQPGLHRADVIKQTKRNECDDISGDGERQKQCPGKKSPSRKITYRSKPCQAHSQQRGAERHPKASQKVFTNRLGQCRFDQMLPYVARWREKRGDNGADGYQYKRSDEEQESGASRWTYAMARIDEL